MDVRLLILVVLFQITHSANILCIYSTVSHSHFLFAESLLVELSRRGHNVTVASQYARPMPIGNYTAIIIPPNEDLLEVMKTFTDKPGNKLIVLSGLLSMSKTINSMLGDVLNQPELLKIRRDGNIDLLITEGMLGDAMLGFAAEFKCPSVQISSVPPVLEFFRRMGNPLSLSYVPNTYLSSSGEPMGFVTRVVHFLTSLFEIGVFNILTNRVNTVYREHFPAPEYPSMDEMRYEVSLILINTHFSQGIVRPLVPGILEVSGMHIKPTSPLPQDLAEFMDNSPNGVILFSLGTNVKSSSLSMYQMKIFLKTFQNLKENILWKFDDDQIKSLPSNVKILRWLPQNDLLAHPNLKMFITHAGLGSVFEAKYHGVPLVLIPIFGDQIGNAEQVVAEGWGRSLTFTNITMNEFEETVYDVLKNDSYKERAQYMSLLYRDRPQTAMETALFWIEYVIRHKGAPHMKSNARHINFFQLHSIDVIGFLIASLLIIISVIYIFTKLLIKRICKIFKNKIKND